QNNSRFHHVTLFNIFPSAFEKIFYFIEPFFTLFHMYPKVENCLINWHIIFEKCLHQEWVFYLRSLGWLRQPPYKTLFAIFSNRINFFMRFTCLFHNSTLDPFLFFQFIKFRVYLR